MQPNIPPICPTHNVKFHSTTFSGLRTSVMWDEAKNIQGWNSGGPAAPTGGALTFGSMLTAAVLAVAVNMNTERDAGGFMSSSLGIFEGTNQQPFSFLGKSDVVAIGGGFICCEMPPWHPRRFSCAADHLLEQQEVVKISWCKVGVGEGRGRCVLLNRTATQCREWHDDVRRREKYELSAHRAHQTLLKN